MSRSIAAILIAYVLILTILLGTGCNSLAVDKPASSYPAEQTPVSAAPVEDDLPPERDEVMDFVATLSLEQKVGQLLIAGFAPLSTKQIETLIRDYHLGGIILFRRNFSSLEEMVDVVNTLNTMNKGNALPLFMSMDEEGGTVSRLPAVGTKLPDARLFGVVDDPDLTLRAGEVVGRELRSLGINMNYAPVLDVYLRGTSFLYHRSYGTDPGLVSRQGIAFMRGLQSEGIIGVSKHFPGHGATPVDSHLNMPTITADISTVRDRELQPFVAAIGDGATAIMAGHLSFPTLDPSGLPATRSRIILTELLRNELGFDGLIITDDIEMKAYLNGATLEEAVVETVNAGADLLIIAHSYEKQVLALEAIKSAVLDGRICMDQLDASVARIVRMKQQYCTAQDMVSLTEAQRIVGTAKHKEVVAELLERLGK